MKKSALIDMLQAYDDQQDIQIDINGTPYDIGCVVGRDSDSIIKITNQTHNERDELQSRKRHEEFLNTCVQCGMVSMKHTRLSSWCTNDK